jgi:hypothetical protein
MVWLLYKCPTAALLKADIFPLSSSQASTCSGEKSLILEREREEGGAGRETEREK